ncbi:MAG: nucleotidyltransferase domain-containing protein [Planctomycetes bacterium]|nr:nucleotidyltransferase domain-containing protein [Planctomycetota bacterium]
MADDMVTGLIRQYLRNLREAGIHATSGVLFGSFARGNARDWSDIDLVVVSPRFDLPYELADVETLWVVAGRTDSRIEPIPCGEHQWLEDNGSEIIELARREGRRIALEEAV